MSYDNRSHRGYHPYQRNQQYQPDYRSNYRQVDDRRNGHNDRRTPGSGPHGDSFSAGRPYVHAYGGAGSFQSPHDHRNISNNAPQASYSQQQHQDRRMMFPPQDQRQSFQNPHSSHSFTGHSSDRPFTRHSTGSSNSFDPPGSRFREAVISNVRRESDPAPYSSSDRRNNSTAPNELQSRTLVVKQFHQNVTKELLKELFHQVGPVRNVVLKPDHAFIEFQDSDSVAYALAAMDNVHMFGVRLRLEPKLNDADAFRFVDKLRMFEQQPELFGVFQ